MKNEKLFSILTAILVIVGATFKILHLPYDDLIFDIGFLGAFLLQIILITQLKKRIKELESKLKE